MTQREIPRWNRGYVTIHVTKGGHASRPVRVRLGTRPLSRRAGRPWPVGLSGVVRKRGLSGAGAPPAPADHIFVLQIFPLANFRTGTFVYAHLLIREVPPPLVNSLTNFFS